MSSSGHMGNEDTFLTIIQVIGMSADGRMDRHSQII